MNRKQPAYLIVIGVVTLFAGGSQALASEPVDPSTLNPPPPPEFNPVCERVGNQTICEVQFSDPPFAGGSEVICGSGPNTFEPFQFQDRSVRGKRYYDQDGNLVRRHYREYFDGTLVNPINHNVVAYSGSDTVMNDLAVPGELPGTEAITGSVRIFLGQGNGTMALDTGRVVDSAQGILHESGQHPFFLYFVYGDTAAAQPLCDALQ